MTLSEETVVPPPRAAVASSLERLFQRMRDASNLPLAQASAANLEPPPETRRQLRRTSSSASLDTIRAPSPKGCRDRTEQSGPKTINTNKEHATKKNRPSQPNKRRKNPPELSYETECSPGQKRANRGRQTSHVVQDADDRTQEEDISDITARLLKIAPTAAWALQPSLFSRSADGTLSLSVATNHPPKEDGQLRSDCSFPTRNLKPGDHIDKEAERTTSIVSQIATVNINDLSLILRPYEPDLTIWDGHKATHHIFTAHLFLRCTAQHFGILSLPDVHLEILCATLPVSQSRTRTPSLRLQTTYKGALVDVPTAATSPPAEVDPANGIHVSKTWGAMMDGDGTCQGWYVTVFVPVPTRFFLKMEYRRFELVGRVWVGENVLEDALTFGMSMLFRSVDMK